MRVLLDTCVWGGALEVVRGAGHDTEWVGERDSDPGDEAILEEAHAQARVLVTLDKDFGELAIVHGRPHSGIIRLVGLRGREQGPSVVEVLESHGDQLRDRAILTVYADRIRVRPGESEQTP